MAILKSYSAIIRSLDSGRAGNSYTARKYQLRRVFSHQVDHPENAADGRACRFLGEITSLCGDVLYLLVDAEKKFL
jgi:hypothetical protein